MIYSHGTSKPAGSPHFYTPGLKLSEGISRPGIQFNLYKGFLEFQKSGTIAPPFEAINAFSQLTAADYRDAQEAMRKEGKFDPTLPYLAENAWKYKAASSGHYREGFRSQFTDVTQKMLHFDPTQRLGAGKAQKHAYIADGIRDNSVALTLKKAIIVITEYSGLNNMSTTVRLSPAGHRLF